MGYQVTRPDTDQVKFTSSKTGDWVLEDYIQNAELGNMTIAQLLGLIFFSDGSFRESLTATVGTVTTGAAGSSVIITNVGTARSLILNFTIPRGDQGATGNTGRGISTVIRTSGTGAAGTTDTYTITYSDSTTSTFNVFNGANGSGTAGTATPLMNGTAASGTDAANFSRQDHVHPTDTTRAPTANPTFTGGLKETRSVMAANNIDLNAGSVFTKTITVPTTFTVSNVPTSGTVASFLLDLTNGAAFSITWWSGVQWAGGTAPSLTSAGRDVLGFFTHNGGVTWTGLLLGKDVR